MANTHILVARALIMQGEFERASATLDEAQAILHDTGYYGHDQVIVYAHGSIEYSLGHLEAAEGLYTKAIELCAISTEPIVLTLPTRHRVLCPTPRRPGARTGSCCTEDIKRRSAKQRMKNGSAPCWSSRQDSLRGGARRPVPWPRSIIARGCGR